MGGWTYAPLLPGEPMWVDINVGGESLYYVRPAIGLWLREPVVWADGSVTAESWVVLTNGELVELCGSSRLLFTSEVEADVMASRQLAGGEGGTA